MKEITDQDFQNAISSGTVVVDFYADWCQPCRMLAPVLEKVSLEFASVDFVKIDVEANHATTDKYKINSLPTIIVFKNGEIAEKTTGLLNEKKLVELVQRHV